MQKGGGLDVLQQVGEESRLQACCLVVLELICFCCRINCQYACHTSHTSHCHTRLLININTPHTTQGWSHRAHGSARHRVGAAASGQTEGSQGAAQKGCQRHTGVVCVGGVCQKVGEVGVGAVLHSVQPCLVEHSLRVSAHVCLPDRLGVAVAVGDGVGAAGAWQQQ